MIDHINSLVLMTRYHVLVAHHDWSASIQRALSLCGNLVDIVIHDIVVAWREYVHVGGIVGMFVKHCLCQSD